MVDHHYMHDSSDWMVATIPESVYLSFLPDGCSHTSDRVFICTFLWMVVPMPHIHVSEISVVLVLAHLPTMVFGLNTFS